MSKIIIAREKMNHKSLKEACEAWFGDMVKIVVDIENEIVGLGGDLHADAEHLLIEKGSDSRNIWGVNFYPWHEPDQRIEWQAMINIRPKLGNASMDIQDEGIRQKIKTIIKRIVLESDEKLV